MKNNGDPVIIDFGSCEFLKEDEELKLKYQLGSPAYMSP